MVKTVQFLQLIHSFEGVCEEPHFDKRSFKIKKKIFATLNEKENRCCVKLPLQEQDLFCSFDKTVIWPVDNKWGLQGWTLINLAKVRKDTLRDAVHTAYTYVALGNRKK